MKNLFVNVIGALILVAIVILVMSFITTPAYAGWFTPDPPSSDKQMSQKAEQQSKQIDQAVGFPSVINGFEKRMVRMLYELRDNPEYQTTTYIVTLEGKFVKVCDSIGYGINASIQFSNPEKTIDNGDSYGNGWAFLPQAEPNGLFMPEGLSATYVMCVKGDDLVPVYLEPEIIVSPFPLESN